MCLRWGVNRIGFLTFTFADDVRTIAEAQKRFHSAFSNALGGRYSEWICVVQRHKDDRIHFHLVVAMSQDIRTGFDFAAVGRRDYASASAYLKAEWKFLRETLPDYQFGRHELLPVKNPAGFGMYVARYVGRTFHTRRDEKGARLVRFSRGFQRCVMGSFSTVDIIGKRARGRIPRVCEMLGYKNQEAMEKDIGPRWHYHLARTLYASDTAFACILTATEHSLEYYGGALFVLRDEWEKHDRRALEWERLHPGGEGQGSLC